MTSLLVERQTRVHSLTHSLTHSLNSGIPIFNHIMVFCLTFARDVIYDGAEILLYVSTIFTHADRFRNFLFAFLCNGTLPMKHLLLKEKLYLPVTKIAEFVNSVDLDEVAHNEPPHLDRHCLPSSL